jgi:hypothetical protein
MNADNVMTFFVLSKNCVMRIFILPLAVEDCARRFPLSKRITLYSLILFFIPTSLLARKAKATREDPSVLPKYPHPIGPIVKLIRNTHNLHVITLIVHSLLHSSEPSGKENFLFPL